MKRKFLAYAGLIGGLFVFSSASVQAHENLPACSNEKVLKKIVKRFNKTEKTYWSHRGLVLSNVSGPHIHRDYFLTDSPIGRRYCHADAHFEDGRSRRMHFLIEENAGFAGFGWNVEYCVHGLDPWKYYDGRCRVLSR